MIPRRPRQAIQQEQERIKEHLIQNPHLRHAEIARALGVSPHKVYDASGALRVQPPTTIKKRIAIIKQFQEQRKPIPPQLWALSRTMDLAPTHSSKDIYSILKEEKKSDPTLDQAPLLNQSSIAKCIREGTLRSPEEQRKIILKGFLKTTRPANKLSKKQRELLANFAAQHIKIMRIRYYQGVSTEDIKSELFLQAQKEIERAPFDANLSDEALTLAFKKYFRRKEGTFIISILRRIGPRKRNGEQRHPFPIGNMNRTPAKKTMPRAAHSIPLPRIPTTILSPLERKIYGLILKKMDPLEIANTLGILRSTVNVHVFKIRKKAKAYFERQPQEEK